ncbi:MAG: hypothetical protein LBS57_00480 [Treponema sp.]|jgi:hypothetical protein|nr:hypothetical protein [Treponema sp.]
MKNKKLLKKLEFKLFLRRIRKLLEQNPWRDDPFSPLWKLKQKQGGSV